MTQQRAIVTGASAGIGAEYARQLAQRGFDLLLVARREERLLSMAHELRQKYGVSAEIHPTNLADPTETTTLCDYIRSQTDITMLVNNAGFGTENTILKEPVASQLGMLHLHTTAPYLLCQAVLPQMVARQGGAIINVSSIAAFFHGPGAANYCATKAYLNSFSQSLQLEVAQHGITVQALCPGYTVTEFHDTAHMQRFERGNVPEKLWDSAEFVVSTSIAALKQNNVIVIPGRKNRMLVLTGSSPLLASARKLAGHTVRLLRRSNR